MQYLVLTYKHAVSFVIASIELMKFKKIKNKNTF